jgi:hypothetical protein
MFVWYFALTTCWRELKETFHYDSYVQVTVNSSTLNTNSWAITSAPYLTPIQKVLFLCKRLRPPLIIAQQNK